ncbi:MAG: CDP-alcohol phosphatidyltransferase family protein [Clostridia bacterium]|nr:CDP-alcohol phosphatidyltransferase family protein [Clostridia bacterium]
MIGIYDYTVILTYLSLLSAGTGIFVTLSGSGHPYIGVICLLFCGLCDAFDGKVASMKKDRTDSERKYGIQIDSLSDLIAFGVLPACIGVAFIRNSALFNGTIDINGPEWYCTLLKVVLYGFLVLYILTAMIRLAYFNVSEEERQSTETGARKYYLGLPVTSASVIFPFVAVLEYLIKADLTILYIATIVLVGILFVCPFKLRKLGVKGILVLVAVGLVEFVALLITYFAR